MSKLKKVLPDSIGIDSLSILYFKNGDETRSPLLAYFVHDDIIYLDLHLVSSYLGNISRSISRNENHHADKVTIIGLDSQPLIVSTLVEMNKYLQSLVYTSLNKFQRQVYLPILISIIGLDFYICDALTLKRQNKSMPWDLTCRVH